jgi:threonylcarbamoyladenosine tRNA methylthiotransferase MtaB
MPRYSIHNFGCRASAADGDAIAASLEHAGAIPCSSRADADVLIVNTCAVTANAERTARALIRRARRENPDLKIVVTGCYAQRAPHDLQALPGVAAVLGNSHKALVAQAAINSLAPAQQRPSASGFVPLASLATTHHAPFPERHFPEHSIAGEHHDAATDLPLAIASPRTRPILKVQDGCGNRCSFCVIPETRGPSRSVPLAQALAAARTFAETGGQELVLSGINLGRWGRDLTPARTLPELVRALLEETALPRLRISSIEPMDWGPELLALMTHYGHGEHPRLAPHAHLPLQSGADAILRRMHRRYRPWHYAEKVHTLRAHLPDAAIGADVMIGFPGETDALFEENYTFLAALPLTYLHLFPFSPRPRTAAEAFHRDAAVPPATVHARMQALQALAADKQQAFADRFLGHSLSAVTLRDNTALTANFLHVPLPTPSPANRMLLLRIPQLGAFSDSLPASR